MLLISNFCVVVNIDITITLSFALMITISYVYKIHKQKCKKCSEDKAYQGKKKHKRKNHPKYKTR